jgi:hypothetical protein
MSVPTKLYEIVVTIAANDTHTVYVPDEQYQLVSCYAVHWTGSQSDEPSPMLAPYSYSSGDSDTYPQQHLMAAAFNNSTSYPTTVKITLIYQ